jgi:hypothetical protein
MTQLSRVCRCGGGLRSREGQIEYLAGNLQSGPREEVYDGRDAIDTAEPLIKVAGILRGHWYLILLPHAGKVATMERFWSSLAFPYGDTLRRKTSRAPFSALTNLICRQRRRL